MQMRQPQPIPKWSRRSRLVSYVPYCISSVSNKSLNDGSTSLIGRQVTGWEIRGINMGLMRAIQICQLLFCRECISAPRRTLDLYTLPDLAQAFANSFI